MLENRHRMTLFGMYSKDIFIYVLDAGEPIVQAATPQHQVHQPLTFVQRGVNSIKSHLQYGL